MAITRDKEGHYIICKRVVQPDDITLVSIYASNLGVPSYINKILVNFKKEIGSHMDIVTDFHTLLSTVDRTSKQKNKKNIAELDDMLDQIGLIDIYRIFQPKGAKYTFFSNTSGSFSKIDHVVGHKTNLNKIKKIQIISCIFSDHNGLKPEINFKNTTQKYSNTWRLNNMLLNNE